ncbi:MAG TPA: glycosyltransferase [Bacteroidota bacterium]|nr:glycosyltransferase [Bacteroidota bacterium]
MKITIVGTAYPLRGGIAHYNALLYRELGARHAVDIVTFRRQYPGFLFPGKTQQEEGAADGFRVPAEVLVDSINPLNWVTTGRRIRSRRPDLVIFKYWLPFFGPCFGTIARVVKRGSDAKVLFICDNVVPHERRPGDRLFTRYAFGAVDSFVVQSRAVERDLLAFVPEASYAYVPHPVYNGFGSTVPVADARHRLGITARYVLLFFGYVRKYKGLDVLLDAVALLKDQLDLALIVVGEIYDGEQAYREQILRLGLASRVTLRSDYVPNDEVKYYFSAADAVVLPYTSATQSGIAQIAYNFDLPVIASDVGGLSEVVHDGVTGALVPPGDPRALASKILEYCTTMDRERLRAAVREEKKQYSWENLVAAIERLGR